MQSGIKYAFHSAVKSEARARKLPKSQLAFQRIRREEVVPLQNDAFAPEIWAVTEDSPPKIRGDSVHSRSSLSLRLGTSAGGIG